MNRFLTLLLMVCLSASAQKKQTLTYFQNDTLALQLDLYMPKKVTKAVPLVIFVHGGGFSGGVREDGTDFCKMLAQNGYAAATISYTLYMKNKKFSCDGRLTEKVKAFQHGVSDLWLATEYFLRTAEKFKLDKTKFFIAGSSAGAETVLHAAFWPRDKMNLYPAVPLKADFKYAGLISGAGAMMDLNAITAKNKIPMFLFHGNGDGTVPYGTASHHYCKPNASGWLMLFGSYAIYNHLTALDASVALHTYCGGGHEYSAALFKKDSLQVVGFLNDVVSGKKFRSHTIVPTGKKNELSSAYSFCD